MSMAKGIESQSQVWVTEVDGETRTPPSSQLQETKFRNTLHQNGEQRRGRSGGRNKARWGHAERKGHTEHGEAGRRSRALEPDCPSSNPEAAASWLSVWPQRIPNYLRESVSSSVK